ncbi:MAG: tetratricopeptide repeat protein [Alphaproteobacteria bacterium]|uniref:Tetratricopeptide repeat protein n=1 Tax=Candidatus Nitrobium versatile TaxID=2884831 RepID=A0A953JA88_9BACT|nr:tetratricopeptide repeat protein [Candidatus Nitrobium versatile]
MRIQKAAVLFVLISLLVSCAGFRISGAKSEFQEGLSLFNRGQYEAAIPHFQKATELDPDLGQAYLYLGRSYLSLRRWSQAITPLRTALRLSPEETRREISNLLIDALLGAAEPVLPKER